MWSFCGRRRDCGAPAICILWINDASGDCKDSRCEGKSGYSGPGGNSANGNGRWKSVSRWLWRQPAGESRWSPVIPMQWTVVAIAIGGGADGEGARPSPLSHRVARLVTPPHPARPSASSPARKRRGQCGDTQGKTCPDTMNFWCEPVGLAPIAPRQGSRPFSEEVGD